MTSPVADVAMIVTRFDEAWARRDIDALMSLIAEDCVDDASVGPGPGRRHVGRQEVRHGVLEMLAYDQDGDGPGEMVLCDATRALVLWTVRHETADGSVVSVRGCDVFEVRDGLICRKDAFRKSLP